MLLPSCGSDGRPGAGFKFADDIHPVRVQPLRPNRQGLAVLELENKHDCARMVC